MENIFSQTNEEFNFKRVYLHKKLETKPSFTDKDLAKEVYDFKIDELRGMKENIPLPEAMKRSGGAIPMRRLSKWIWVAIVGFFIRIS